MPLDVWFRHLLEQITGEPLGLLDPCFTVGPRVLCFGRTMLDVVSGAGVFKGMGAE